ncbi:MAG: uridine kinase, partial [Proteobacteria bacterium]
PLVAALGRGVIRASVDGFHNPREVRYKRGKDAETFFSDSYNYDELKRVLLNPLSPGGNREYTPSIFNVDEDRTVVRELKLAGESDILIFDGIFLHRQELRHYWDFSVFLDVSFEQSIPRGAQRGAGSPDILDTSNARYINGQKNYLQQFLPQNIATVHVDYNDLKFPRIVRINQG